MTPEQTFGGDDDKGSQPYYEEQRKKPKLDKFASRPDMNIRDVFWEIMAGYAAKSITKEQIGQFSDSKSTLIKIAVSVIDNPQNSYYGLSSGFTATYTLMMIFDCEWEGAFAELLEETSGPKKEKTRSCFIAALGKLWKRKVYNKQILDYLKKMLISVKGIGPATEYINEINEPGLIQELKKWIMVVARTDVEGNQRNAIEALVQLIDEPEVKQLLLSLMSHWDPATREAIIMIFEKRKDDEFIKMVKQRAAMETDPKLRKMLGRIIKKS